MNKVLEGYFLGASMVEALSRIACFAAGAVLLLELARLAERYGALITYAMRGPTSF